MEKTKLYFKLERDFNDVIEVIANNHIDLKNYLESKHGITVKPLDVNLDVCTVKVPNDSTTYYAEIRWAVHI
jgi:hypothetical protein